MKYGSWTLELAKGKPSIEIASSEALIKALESIKAAVEVGGGSMNRSRQLVQDCGVGLSDEKLIKSIGFRYDGSSID